MEADRQAALLLSLVIVSPLLLGGLPFVVTGDAAAQEDTSALDRITGGEVGTLDRIEAANQAIAAVANRIGYELRVLPFVGEDDPPTAADHASDLTDTVNAHNATLEDYVNARTNASEDMDTLRVDVTTDGETATRYLTASVNNTSDDYEGLEMVASTNRSVDGTLVLEDYAAANAAEELEAFVEDYAAEGRDIDAKLTRRLTQQYAGDVTLPDGGED